MRGLFPVIFVLVLGFSGAAAAQEDNPWLEADRVKAELDLCQAEGRDIDPLRPEKCSDQYYEQCTYFGKRTSALDMMFCRRALKEYWEAVVVERETAAISIGNQRIADWVQESHPLWEAYRKARCSRLHMSIGSIFGPIFEMCMSETARQRAVDLSDFLGEKPLIVPELE